MSGPFRIAERSDDALVLERRAGLRQRRAPGNVARRRVRAEPWRRARPRSRAASSTWSRCATRPGSPTRCRPHRRGRGDRAGGLVRLPRVRPLESAPRRTSTSAAPSRHAIDREALAEHAPRTTWWSPPAGSCRRRCRATRRTSSRGSTPSWRATCSRVSGVTGRSSSRASDDWRPIVEAIAELARRARRRRRGAVRGRWTRRGSCTRPWDGVHRAHRRHRLAARLHRPGVLPAAAAPLRVEDQRGRLLACAVRRADRARAPGTQRPVAAASSSTRPTGWRSPTGSR